MLVLKVKEVYKDLLVQMGNMDLQDRLVQLVNRILEELKEKED